jgi:hypothetical protein
MKDYIETGGKIGESWYDVSRLAIAGTERARAGKHPRHAGTE